MRTRLVSITGTFSSLAEDTAPLDEATRRILIETAREEAERLNRLVGNLLDITRLEAGALRAAQQPCPVQDVIGAALERLAERLHDHPVTVEATSSLPFVPMDFVLNVQVLVNLVDNTLKYSLPDSPINVDVRASAGYLEIAIADRGIGTPSEDLERVFDKFYRVQRPDGVIGTGLGLAICKGIIEAHGGRIWDQNRPGGGTVVTLSLPLNQPKQG